MRGKSVPERVGFRLARTGSMSDRRLGFARWIWLLLGLLGALTLPGCSLFPKEDVEEAPPLLAPPPSRMVVYTVKRGYIAEEITVMGKVGYSREKSLYFRKGGRLKLLPVRMADTVKIGQVVAQLEAGDLPYQLKLAKLNLEQADIRLDKVRKWVGLEGGVSKEDWQLMLIDREKAKLEVERVTEQIDSSSLRVPFAGKVVGVNVSEGDYVNEFEEVLTIGDPSGTEVQVELSPAQLLKVGKGTKAKLKLESGQGERWVEGYVARMPGAGGERGPTGSTRNTVSVKPKDPSVKLEYDQFVMAVFIVREKQDALIVPNAAIRDYMGRTYLRIVEGDVRREADVEIGIQGTTDTEIQKGVKEGEKVVGK